MLGILGDVSAVELPEGIEAELQQSEEVISTGRDAEDTIFMYADWLVSTTSTITSTDREAGPGGIADPHPSSINPLREGPFKLNPLQLTTLTTLLTVFNGTSAVRRGTAGERLAPVQVSPQRSSVGLGTRSQSVGR